MRIRTYEPRDREGCLSVCRSAVPHFIAPHEVGLFEAFLSKLPGDYLVIESDGRIIACGGYAIEPEKRTATLCWGLVEVARHGGGVGRLLLQTRLDAIRRTPDVDAVELGTSQHTAGFFKRFGFELVRITADGFAPGLDRHDMRLDLAQTAGSG